MAAYLIATLCYYVWTLQRYCIFFIYATLVCIFLYFLRMRGELLLRSKQNKKLQRLKVGKKLYHCTTFAKSGVSA